MLYRWFIYQLNCLVVFYSSISFGDSNNGRFFFLPFFLCRWCHWINPAASDAIAILELAAHDIYIAPTLSPWDTRRIAPHARRIIHPRLVHLRDFILGKGWAHSERHVVPAGNVNTKRRAAHNSVNAELRSGARTGDKEGKYRGITEKWKKTAVRDIILDSESRRECGSIMGTIARSPARRSTGWRASKAGEAEILVELDIILTLLSRCRFRLSNNPGILVSRQDAITPENSVRTGRVNRAPDPVFNGRSAEFKSVRRSLVPIVVHINPRISDSSDRETVGIKKRAAENVSLLPCAVCWSDNPSAQTQTCAARRN